MVGATDIDVAPAVPALYVDETPERIKLRTSIANLSLRDVSEELQLYAAYSAWCAHLLGELEARIIRLKGTLEIQVEAQIASMSWEGRTNKEQRAALAIAANAGLLSDHSCLSELMAQKAQLVAQAEGFKLMRDTLSRQLAVFDLERERR